MRFIKRALTARDNILEIERAYLPSSHSPTPENQDQYIEIPSTLVGLAQIVEYYKPGSELSRSSVWDPNSIHRISRDLIKHDSKEWIEEFETAMKKIEGMSDELIKEQILPKKALLKQAVLLEAKAIENGEVIFWRFDRGNQAETSYTGDIKGGEALLSISDSLLAGYIQDGKYNCNPMYGFSNFSACTFSYHEGHTMLLHAARNNGNYKSEGREYTLRPDYISEQGPLENHQLYGIRFTYEEIRELQDQHEIIIPNFCESAAVCFGAGEKFHPRIKAKAITEIVALGRKIDLYSNCELHEILFSEESKPLADEVIELYDVTCEQNASSLLAQLPYFDQDYDLP